MAGKISELAGLDPATAANGDFIEVVDTSDTSMAATGTNKKMMLADLWTWLAVPSDTQAIETVAGSTYSVVYADAGKLKRLTGTATVTLSGELLTGQRVDFVCIGGAATFALGGGATWDVAPTPSAVARAVGSFVTAIKMGASKWALTGDLA